MEKLFSILFLLIIPVTGFSQINISNKLWYNGNGGYMRTDSTSIRFQSFSNNHDDIELNSFYSIVGDTLKLFYRNSTEFYSLVNDTFQRNVKYTNEVSPAGNFLIKMNGEDQLTLTPTDSIAIYKANMVTYTKGKNILSYKEIHHFPNNTIKFEKIIFNTTECFGQCPVMSLEINSNRKIKFIGEKYTSKKGFFTGEISGKQFAELLYILRYSQLDQLESDSPSGSNNLSTNSLEVHYNGKMRNFKTRHLSLVLDDLTTFLLALPDRTNMIESKDEFEIKINPVLK